MEALQEIDSRRIEAEAKAIANQEARDARILKTLLILLGIFLLTVFILSLVFLSSGS
jgi:hypothetical protein